MKRIRWIAMLFLAAVLSLGLAACQKSIELIGWTDGSASAELGAVYEFRDLTVEDTEGNTYTATVSVRDSEGNPVELISNRFTVTDIGGYTAVYTVTLEGNDTRTRTVEISVADTGNPVIVVGSVANGTVNQPYTLPEITVMDQSGETIEPGNFRLSRRRRGKDETGNFR